MSLVNKFQILQNDFKIGDTTLKQLLKNNEGPQGPQGEPGKDGKNGIDGTNGTNGTNGTDGSDGNFGGLSYNMTFDTSIISGDPGQGKIRFNEANQNTSTEIYINNADKYGNLLDTFLTTLSGVANDVQKGFITISKLYSPEDYIIYSVSDIIHNTGWWTLSVLIQSFSAISPFINNDNIIVSYSIAGGAGFTNYINVRNNTAGTINKGDLVYVTGSQTENRVYIAKAKADDSSTMPCIGVLNQTLAPNENGVAVTYGKVKGLDTSSCINEGDIIYVSTTTAGEIEPIKPTNGNLIQNIGIVTKKNATAGVIFVTGIGRANDIPNSNNITSLDYTSNYLYAYTGSTDPNRFQKITVADLGSVAKSHNTTIYNGTIVGEIVYATELNKLRMWNGSSWETITSS